MKKQQARKRALVLDKETIHVLASNDLKAVAGGATTFVLTCDLTVRTCVSFEFAC